MKDVIEFLKALKTDPRGRQLLKAAKEPAGIEEAVDQYAGIAKELGISVSRENMLKFLKDKERIQKSLTAKAEEQVKTTLQETDLDMVAGGVIETQCESTFDRGEWCWSSDSCYLIINSYEAPDQGNPKGLCEAFMVYTPGFEDVGDGWEDWTKNGETDIVDFDEYKFE